jgi:hypothetical protein
MQMIPLPVFRVMVQPARNAEPPSLQTIPEPFSEIRQFVNVGEPDTQTTPTSVLDEITQSVKLGDAASQTTPSSSLPETSHPIKLASEPVPR